MSNAISSVGVKVYKWIGSEWSAIAEILKVNGPTMTKETIDVTNLDTVDGFRKFIGSFKDGGTVQLDMNYTREGYDLMREGFDSNDDQYFRISIPDALQTTLEFVGIVQELPLDASVGSQITLNTTIKVSGQVTVNNGMNSDSPNA